MALPQVHSVSANGLKLNETLGGNDAVSLTHITKIGDEL